jgi:hypothetical protein
MNLFHREHKNLPAPIFKDITKPPVESDADREAKAKSDEAWKDRNKVKAGTGVDELKAMRITQIPDSIDTERERQNRPDTGIRTLNDVFPDDENDAFNTELAKAHLGTEAMPDMNRVHEIGKHVIEVADVTPTPERIEVHLGTHKDVA